MDIQDIPNGKSGNWKIDEFEITEEKAKFENMRMSFTPGMGSRFVEPGKYKRLSRNNKVIMSNTRAEKNDHYWFIAEAKGHVLINGLGLGYALSEILKKDEVKSVTVVEISEDVINLVAPFFKKDKRVTIIHADALLWKPPKEMKYDTVWHDIWDDICIDNIEEMKKLHRKYGRKTKWQGSWRRELCEFYRKEEKKRNSWYY